MVPPFKFRDTLHLEVWPLGGMTCGRKPVRLIVIERSHVRHSVLTRFQIIVA